MSIKIHQRPVEDWRAGVVEHADPNHVHGKTALTPREWRRLAEAKMRDKETLEEIWFVIRTTVPYLPRPIPSLPARWGPAKHNFDNAIREASAIRPGVYGPDSTQQIAVWDLRDHLRAERAAGWA